MVGRKKLSAVVLSRKSGGGYGTSVCRSPSCGEILVDREHLGPALRIRCSTGLTFRGATSPSLNLAWLDDAPIEVPTRMAEDRHHDGQSHQQR